MCLMVVCVHFIFCVGIAVVDLARERVYMYTIERVYMYTRIVLSCAFAYDRVRLSEVTLCD